MRLLQADSHGSFNLTEFAAFEIPSYAILSHTWGVEGEEVTFKDLEDDVARSKAGYEKLRFCAKQAASDHLQYFWVDTCCINKSDMVELQHAINSMFRWYQNATKCYVYLSDVHTIGDGPFLQASWEAAFRASRWFTRGWTLQELIAPKSVEFFSKQCFRLGDKDSLEQQINEITGVPIKALQGSPLSQFASEERISWSEHRQAKYEEDTVYSLQGLFDIHIPLIYGEGRQKAMIRLQREIQESSKGQLLSRIASSPTPSSTIPFQRDRDFIDRGTLLDDVKQKCGVPGSRTALVGLGGIGKSQLAIEYAYRVRDWTPDTWVFWVHVSNAARFEQGYRKIADIVKIPGRDDPKANVLELVHDWLQNENKQKWLLILDNFDDATFLVQEPSTRVETYLPQSENGSMFITTRRRDAALTLVDESDIIAVGPMGAKDAETLFRKKLLVTESSEDVAHLVALLDFMPLAIVQAAAYIAQRAPRCSTRQYIEKFQNSDKEKTNLLKHESGHLRRDWEASSSILITWQLSFEHLHQTQPSAADLLSFMSFFDRQGIPEFLIRNQVTSEDNDESHEIGNGHDGDEENTSDGGSDVGSEDQFESDILTLRHYSFISINVDSATFGMHALVQLATRRWLRKHGKFEDWKQKYITKLCDEFPDGEHASWPKCSVLYPHAKGAVTQKPQGDDSIFKWSILLHNAATYAWGKGVLADADSFAVKSMTARTNIFGVNDSRTLESMNLVGIIKCLGGHWKEAEDVQIKVRETGMKLLGPEHPVLLTYISNLAYTYHCQARWKEAEDLGLQLVETQKRVLGSEHPNTISSISNLSLVYIYQNRWKEAEDLQIQVNETGSRVLNQENPEMLTYMSNLAMIYQSQKRWEEGEHLGLKVLETQKRILGYENLATLISMNNLALLYCSQERWKEAEDLQLQVNETGSRVLNREHPDMLTYMSNLAMIYHNQRRWEEAERLEIQVLEIGKDVLGCDHWVILFTMTQLAEACSIQNREKEAEDLYLQITEIKKEEIRPRASLDAG